MEQQLPEQNTRSTSDTDALESSLRALWDKARLAAERIGRYREENRALQDQVASLHDELRRTQQELAAVQEQLKAHPPEQSQQVNGQEPLFSNGEREVLAGKVKDLLAKLEGYL